MQDADDILILKEFQEESTGLTTQLLDNLEKIEGDFSKVQELEQYGQIVDRIMGGAKSMAMGLSSQARIQLITVIGDYSGLCKAVSYKASQITENENFFDVCVAILLDATEMLVTLISNVTAEKPLDIKDVVTKTFLDRLKWASAQFPKNTRESVAVKPEDKKKMNQNEIDDLLSKLGLG